MIRVRQQLAHLVLVDVQQTFGQHSADYISGFEAELDIETAGIALVFKGGAGIGSEIELAEANVRGFEADVDDATINVGTGTSISILDLARIFSDEQTFAPPRVPSLAPPLDPVPSRSGRPRHGRNPCGHKLY